MAHLARTLGLTAFVCLLAPAAHAGIAFETFTPGQTPGDYTSSTVLLDNQVISGEGGAISFFHNPWFTFSMPHTASLTGITVPIKVNSASSGVGINFGFWLGTSPQGSSFGGVTLPAANLVVGQVVEYVLDFAPGFVLSQGQNVTIEISFTPFNTLNKNGNANLFLTDVAGQTREKSLGVIFGPTSPPSTYLAIQIRDNSAPAPEPASAALLAAPAWLLLKRRRRV